MKTPKTTVVVPTIREECIREFLQAWREEFAGAHVIIVEDNPERSFDLGEFGVTHLCWRDIDADLGDNAWIVPRRTDCVRSYGYWKACADEPDMIVTLDDDCFPLGPGFLEQHWQHLEAPATEPAWTETAHGPPTRGVPFYRRERSSRCVLNHGMWTNVPDYDAPTQMMQARRKDHFGFHDFVVPRGQYFPMCGMNLAFRPEVVPALYFMLMGRGYPYDRFGDIWAGVFVKKIADHLGQAICSGDPAIEHRRASNVWANLRKEAPGLEVNESLWAAVDGIVLSGTSFAGCYREVSDALADLADNVDYFASLHRAMNTWAGLFDDSSALHEEQHAALQNFGG